MAKDIAKFELKERMFRTCEGTISLEEIKNCIDSNDNDFFSRSEIQRKYDENRIKNAGVGFIGAIWASILSKKEGFSDEALEFIAKLRNVKENTPMTNTTIIVNKHGKVTDAQHRIAWSMDYLNNKFSISEEDIGDERIANKLWDEIVDENPELAKDFLAIEFRVVVADVEGTVEGKLFSNINNSKPISQKDAARNICGGAAAKACRTFEESTINKSLFSSFYPKGGVDVFFRAYCFLTGANESKQIWRNLYLSLNKEAGNNEESALKILNNIAHIYNLALKENPAFVFELKDSGIHAVNAIMKIAYDESQSMAPSKVVKRLFSAQNRDIVSKLISYNCLDNDGEVITLNAHSTTTSVTARVESIFRNRLVF